MVESPRQVEQPSEKQLAEAIASKPPEVQELVLAMRRMVLETLPDVKEALDTKDGMLGYGARQYGASGWGIAAVAGFQRWADLAFVSGATLPDPEGLLEGTGKSMRHVKLRSPEELEARRAGRGALLEAAASLEAPRE